MPRKAAHAARRRAAASGSHDEPSAGAPASGPIGGQTPRRSHSSAGPGWLLCAATLATVLCLAAAARPGPAPARQLLPQPPGDPTTLFLAANGTLTPTNSSNAPAAAGATRSNSSASSNRTAFHEKIFPGPALVSPPDPRVFEVYGGCTPESDGTPGAEGFYVLCVNGTSGALLLEGSWRWQCLPLLLPLSMCCCCCSCPVAARVREAGPRAQCITRAVMRH